MSTQSVQTQRDEIIRSFGRRLANMLVERDITRDEFAAGVGRDKSTISNWINGRSFPRPDDLISISRFLNSSVDKLMGLNGSTETHEAGGFCWVEQQPTADVIQNRHQLQKIRQGIQFFNELMQQNGYFSPQQHSARLRAMLTAIYSGHIRLLKVPQSLELESKIQKRYNLKHVLVLDLPPDYPQTDTAFKLELVAFLAGRQALIKDDIEFDEYVGLGSGRTIFRFVENTIPTTMHFKDVMWTGLTMEANSQESFTNHPSGELASLMRSRHTGSESYRPAYHEKGVPLPGLPEWVDVHRIFAGVTALTDDFAQQAQCFTIQGLSLPLILERLNRRLRNSPIDRLNYRIVGMYLGHLIDEYGNEVTLERLKEDLYVEKNSAGAHYLALMEAELKKIQAIEPGLIRYHVQEKHSVWLMAAGNYKARATEAIVEGGLANCLVIDSHLAKQLLSKQCR